MAITQSFQEYKGYTIRIRESSDNVFGYSIIKQTPNSSSPGGMKNIYLRVENYYYIAPEKLLFKAKNYIDNFEDRLIEKFNRLTSWKENKN